MDKENIESLKEQIDEQGKLINDLQIVIRQLVAFNKNVVNHAKAIHDLTAFTKTFVGLENAQRKTIELLQFRIDALERQAAELIKAVTFEKKVDELSNAAVSPPKDQGDIHDRSYS